jgi:creatinine amidohydrolase/Fe(II)-dependent formamide hydrolase-like protein
MTQDIAGRAGVVGRAADATDAHGALLAAAATKRLVLLLREAAAFDLSTFREGPQAGES